MAGLLNLRSRNPVHVKVPTYIASTGTRYHTVVDPVVCLDDRLAAQPVEEDR